MDHELKQRLIASLTHLTICCGGTCKRSKEAKALIEQVKES